MKLYLDVESAGLKGPLHLIQYSKGRGKIELKRPLKEDMTDLVGLLQDSNTICIGYNLKFDLYKLYQHFKPKQAWKCQTIDLYQKMLFLSPLKYFPLIGKRSLIEIKRIPKKYSKKIEFLLKEEMEKVLPPIAKISVKHFDKTEELESLKFTINISRRLKEIVKLFLSKKECMEILSLEESLYLPEDLGFKEDLHIPFPTFLEEENYNKLWNLNEKILDNPESKIWEYAKKDIEYLWGLEDYLIDQGNSVEVDDNDMATHIVAYSKYYGFETDYDACIQKYEELSIQKEKIESIFKEESSLFDDFTFNIQSAKQKLQWLKAHAYNPEFVRSSDRKHIELLIQGGLLDEEGLEKAQELLKYGTICQQLKQIEVLIEGEGKCYPDFRIVGTTTNRMAGTGGLNFQGISKDEGVRNLIKVSQMGDFDGLEVTIAATFFQDREMLRELEEGLDSHMMTAKLLLKELEDYSYEELIKIKKDKTHKDYKKVKLARAKGKMIRFALLYFCSPFSVASTLNIDPVDAEELMEEHFFSHYKSMGETRKKFEESFCTADFKTWNIGSVGKMKDYSENIFGSRRYISFEKYFADFLWSQTDKIAAVAKGDEEKILRRKEKGKQKMVQAIRSACLGAASGLQKAVYRQLGNYPIQSSGAELTKKLMRKIWNQFHVPMMNIHDEIVIPSGYEECYEDIKKTIYSFLIEYRKVIPHLNMEWERAQTWGEK